MIYVDYNYNSCDNIITIYNDLTIINIYFIIIYIDLWSTVCLCVCQAMRRARGQLQLKMHKHAN